MDREKMEVLLDQWRLRRLGKPMDPMRIKIGGGKTVRIGADSMELLQEIVMEDSAKKQHVSIGIITGMGYTLDCMLQITVTGSDESVRTVVQIRTEASE